MEDQVNPWFCRSTYSFTIEGGSVVSCIYRFVGYNFSKNVDFATFENTSIALYSFDNK